MSPYLTSAHALALEEFLRELGALRGLRREQTAEICGDLCGLVCCIVSEAVLAATEEMKRASVLDGFDLLDRQREWIFETLRRQLCCPH